MEKNKEPPGIDGLDFTEEEIGKAAEYLLRMRAERQVKEDSIGNEKTRKARATAAG